MNQPLSGLRRRLRGINVPPIRPRAAWNGGRSAAWRAAAAVDAETVILVTLIHARGKGSGVPVRAGGASIWIVRHGKVTRVKLFQSKADALDAVGLSE
jgi:hypothetical protein